AIPTVDTAQLEVVESFAVLRDLLSTADVPETERQALEDALTQAEAGYRGGDPCGAAESLREYEDAAQDYRQAAGNPEHLQGFETLYALGRLLRYDLIAGLPGGSAPCAGEERVNREAGETVDEAHNSNLEFRAVIDFGEPRLVPVEKNGVIYTRVSIP